MANITETTQATNPLAGIFYLIQGGLDKWIDYDDLFNLAVDNPSFKFGSESLGAGSSPQSIDFTNRAGQTAFADATFMILPFAFDVDGVFTPVTIVPASKVAGGFDVVNESGVALTFNYLCFKL